MIAAYANQAVWHRPKTGVDEYGQPAFGRPVRTRGRWLQKRRLVRDAQGEQVISEVSVTMAPDRAISVGDQLSDDGVAYLAVIATSVSRGLAGQAVLTRAYL